MATGQDTATTTPKAKLVDIVVEEVSIVDRAANGERFVVVKRDASGAVESAEIQKAEPAADPAPAAEAKPAEEPGTPEAIEKRGAKISAARFAKIQAALVALQDVIAEVTGGEPVTKADEPKPMGLGELTESIAKALAPQVIEAIRAEAATAIAKAATDATATASAAIDAAVKPLADRVAKSEADLAASNAEVARVRDVVAKSSPQQTPRSQQPEFTPAKSAPAAEPPWPKDMGAPRSAATR